MHARARTYACAPSVCAHAHVGVQVRTLDASFAAASRDDADAPEQLARGNMAAALKAEAATTAAAEPSEKFQPLPVALAPLAEAEEVLCLSAPPHSAAPFAVLRARRRVVRGVGRWMWRLTRREGLGLYHWRCAARARRPAQAECINSECCACGWRALVCAVLGRRESACASPNETINAPISSALRSCSCRRGPRPLLRSGAKRAPSSPLPRRRNRLDGLGPTATALEWRLKGLWKPMRLRRLNLEGRRRGCARFARGSTGERTTRASERAPARALAQCRCAQVRLGM
jgi:hypothetical protein